MFRFHQEFSHFVYYENEFWEVTERFVLVVQGKNSDVPTRTGPGQRDTNLYSRRTIPKIKYGTNSLGKITFLHSCKRIKKTFPDIRHTLTNTTYHTTSLGQRKKGVFIG